MLTSGIEYYFSIAKTLRQETTHKTIQSFIKCCRRNEESDISLNPGFLEEMWLRIRNLVMSETE
jgi:hypothetical protein